MSQNKNSTPLQKKILQLDKKLLFFSPYFYPYISGITQYPYRLFTEGNWSINTTCLSFNHLKNENASKKLNSTTTILHMSYLFRISKGFISPQSLSYFWRETKKHDMVMINLPSFEGVPLAIIAFLQKKPIISLLHCEVLLPFSFINLIINIILNCGVIFQLALSKKIIVETSDYYSDKWIYHFFKNKMDAILPPVQTSSSDDVYLKKLIKLINNYSYVIGFCGRMSSEKGIEVLIESMLLLKNAILIIAGPTGKNVIGEESYFVKIKKLLHQKKISHIFLDILPEKKLSAFYKAIDVLVLPSLNQTEAFGMVQVEAMLQGTPVVASDLPGVRMPIQLTKMGIITKPNNPKEIANAIQQIVLNKKKYTNSHLVDQTKKQFNSQKTYNSIYSIINQVLNIPS